MIINPISFGAGGGLVPMIIVHCDTGSTVQLDGVTGTEVSGVWTFVTTLGTHTVTASKDGETASQTVLVDEVAQFEVTIGFNTYLYNEGDECTALTGGWNIGALDSNSKHTGGNRTRTKNTDNLYLAQTYTGSPSSTCFSSFITTNKINLSGKTKLYIDCEYQGTLNSLTTGTYMQTCVNQYTTAPTSSNDYWDNESARYSLKEHTQQSSYSQERAVFTFNISSQTSAYVSLFICAYKAIGSSTQSFKIYRIWIE